jgi:hypothetical protein
MAEVVSWERRGEAWRAIATASELFLFLSGLVTKVTYEYTGVGADKVVSKKTYWKGAAVVLELTFGSDADKDVTSKEKTGP